VARQFPQCCSWPSNNTRPFECHATPRENSGRLSTLCLLLGWLCQRDGERAGRWFLISILSSVCSTVSYRCIITEAPSTINTRTQSASAITHSLNLVHVLMHRRFSAGQLALWAVESVLRSTGSPEKRTRRVCGLRVFRLWDFLVRLGARVCVRCGCSWSWLLPIPRLQ